MRPTTFVQVYECGPEGSRATHRMPIGSFIAFALERLPPLDIVQLRSDLAMLGRSELKGRYGRWHEYQITNDQAG